MTRFLWILFLLFPASAMAQRTIFVPTCGGTNDTAAFSSLISSIGANTGTIQLPFKNGTRCAVNTLTIPSNVTLDNTDGTGLKVNTAQVLTVLGPVVNPVLKPMFFGPGSVTFAGNTTIGTNGQALLSDGAGGTAWGTVAGGGGGGAVDSVFGRTGPVVAVFGDYTWNLIDKTGGSIADIPFHSASDLSNGTTGTGPVVLRDSPTLVTPSLGVASATSINNLGLSGVSGKTLTVNNSLTLAAAADGFTFTVPGSGTGVLESRTITEGAGLAGNTYDLSANRTLAMGVPSNVSVSSTSSASGTTHSHGVTSSSNPGAAASILVTNASGHLQLVRLGLGTSPTQPLDVNGNILVSASTANLFLKDTSTGWQSANTLVVTPQSNNCIRSTDFTSGLVGWNVCAPGNAEFANVDVRGAIRASIFTFNSINSTAGTLGVFKSAGKLRSDVTVPAGPTYEVTTVTIDIVDPDGVVHAASQIFAANDILRLKDGLAGDTWLKVVSAADQTTFWRYTATIQAGSNNVTYRAGMGVPDYGPSGSGFIILTADQTNAPFEQMATHAASFTTNDANGTLVLTPRMREGNLNGSYGYSADTFGFATGQYGTAGQSWLTAEATNGIRLGSNTTTRIQLNPDGSGFLANSSISWDTAGVLTVASGATIADWAINSGRLSSGTTYLASGFDPPAGAVAWFGKAVGSSHGWLLRDSTGRRVGAFAGASAPSFPFLEMHDGTNHRIVIGGLNDTFNSGPSVNSMGMKVWNSAGAMLAEFSDAQNKIGGWTINTTTINNATVTLDSATGISVTADASFSNARAYRILNGSGSNLGSIFGTVVGASNSFLMVGESVAGQGTTTGIQASAPSARAAQIVLTAFGNGSGSAGAQLSVFHTASGSGFIGVGALAGVVISTSSGSSPAVATTSAALDVQSTVGAFLPPRMTTAQKNALTATDGMVLYDTDLAKLQVRTGGAWVSLH